MATKYDSAIQVDLPFHDNDSGLLARVLAPYRNKSCEYLKSAVVQRCGDKLIGSGKFSIGESCYIDDTGHFNAVEFNICYNQLAYYMIAKSIKANLMDEFADWDMEYYWENQLSNMLITHLSSKFKRSMSARSFVGEIEFGKANLRAGRTKSILFLKTKTRFWDDYSGYSEGEVKLAIIKSNVEKHDICESRNSKASMSFRERLEQLPLSERSQALDDFVYDHFRQALMLESHEMVDFEQSFFDLGVTSLKLTEIQNALEVTLGCEFDITALFNHPTVPSLIAMLKQQKMFELFVGLSEVKDKSGSIIPAVDNSALNALINKQYNL